MDKRMRTKVADQLAEASHMIFELIGELEETIDGAEWVELTALLYLCLSDLVRNSGGTAVKLTLPQAKKLADAHVRTMQAWNVIEKFIKEKNPELTDREIQNIVDLKYFGNAEGEIWNICPTTNVVKCLLPSWLRPDRPENDLSQRRRVAHERD